MASVPRQIRHVPASSPPREAPISATGKPPAPPPDALVAFAGIAARLTGKRIALFLDYDGTLAPIAPRPELAVASQRIRRIVARLATRMPVAVVSGRGLKDVMRMLAVDNIAYAGSHGFEIRDAEGRDLSGGIGDSFRPALARAAKALQARLAPLKGTFVEDKLYSIAIHYRQADPSEHAAICAHVAKEAARHPNLKRTGGKMIHELRPDIVWDKGTAVLRVMEALALSPDDAMPIYIGDDETDEDAFRAIAEWGIGIRVGVDGGTAARFALAGPNEVAAFLERLAAL